MPIATWISSQVLLDHKSKPGKLVMLGNFLQIPVGDIDGDVVGATVVGAVGASVAKSAEQQGASHHVCSEGTSTQAHISSGAGHVIELSIVASIRNVS